MKLVRIPPGEFLMGSPEPLEVLSRAYPNYEFVRIAELGDDRPAHKVRITKAFYFGIHEVTIGQFKQFVEESSYRTEAERDGTGGYGIDLKTREWVPGRRPEYSWRNPGFPQRDDHPVVNVTWNDAMAFCRWLGQKERQTYRLPTEAEWEYACRAGTTSRYHCGDLPESLAKAANIYDASSRKVFPEWGRYALKSDDGYPFTAPVGSFRPNAFGLYDMHGNVWEWCSDWYDEHYYARSPIDDPQGPPSGRLRVRRGGGWHGWPLYVRSAFRNFNTPQSRYLNLGLRVVREEGRH
jgi:formylglycine-generating enzyme required for sulfatase activity